MIVPAIFSFSFNIVYKQYSYTEINYNKRIEKITKKYSGVEEGATVIFGERDLDYLRQDIVPIKPYYLPLFSKVETRKEFNKRIEGFEKIYFNIANFCKKPYETLSGDRGLNCLSENKKIHFFDDSIITFIKQNAAKNLFKIKQIK